MYMEAPANGRRIALSEGVGFGAVETLEAALVRAIVRGEEPVSALDETSIRITARRITRTFGTPAAAFQSVVSTDLAEGILNLKDAPDALADWARFILLTSEFFAFDDRLADYCDRLISAIWDLAFGAALDETVVRLAQSIRHRFCR